VAPGTKHLDGRRLRGRRQCATRGRRRAVRCFALEGIAARRVEPGRQVTPPATSDRRSRWYFETGATAMWASATKVRDVVGLHEPATGRNGGQSGGVVWDAAARRVRRGRSRRMLVRARGEPDGGGVPDPAATWASAAATAGAAVANGEQEGTRGGRVQVRAAARRRRCVVARTTKGLPRGVERERVRAQSG